MTIKGQTHEVTFPSTLEWVNGVYMATANITLDRTRWGITYNSGTVFTDLADKAIEDEMQFTVTLVTQ